MVASRARGGARKLQQYAGKAGREPGVTRCLLEAYYLRPVKHYQSVLAVRTIRKTKAFGGRVYGQSSRTYNGDFLSQNLRAMHTKPIKWHCMHPPPPWLIGGHGTLCWVLSRTLSNPERRIRAGPALMELKAHHI